MSDLYQQFVRTLGLSYRPEQETAFEHLCVDMSRDGFITLLQAETGIGKAYATALAAIDYLQRTLDDRVPRKVILATSTLTLVKDLEHCFKNLQPLMDTLEFYPSVGCLLGKNHFVSPERVSEHIEADWSPGDKVLADKLMAWAEPIEDFIRTYGCLPGDLAPEDVCQTQHSVREDWANERQSVLANDVIITSHAMIGTDMNHSFFEDDRSTYLIIDEGDAFVDHLESMQLISFNIKREFSKTSHMFSARGQEQIARIVEQSMATFLEQPEFSSAERELAAVTLAALSDACRFKKRNLSKEERNWLSEMQIYLDFLRDKSRMSKYFGCGKTKVLQEPSILMLNPYFSRYFGTYSDRFNAVTLMSGSLSVGRNLTEGTKWLVFKLGLKDVALRTAEVSPAQFGSLEIQLCPPAESMYVAGDQLNPYWLKSASSIIEQLSGRTLVVVASHKEAEELGKNIANCIVQEKGEKLAYATERFVSGSASTFITAAGHTGVNFLDANGRSLLKNIVLTRLGFPGPSPFTLALKSSEELKANGMRTKLLNSEFYDGLQKVIRRVKQIIGRGIRASDDEIKLYILDHRFPAPTAFNHKFSALRNAIPRRFMSCYAKDNSQFGIRKTDDSNAAEEFII